MPLYDFKCNRCDSLTTELMKMSEDKTNLKCKAKLDCDGILEQQFDMHSDYGSVMWDSAQKVKRLSRKR